MSARWWTLAVALAAIALTLVQDALPGRDLYHTWQYVAAQGLVLVLAAVAAWRAWRTANARRWAFALIGAVVVGAAGLVASLIGPDTVTVIGSPGTVTPVPDLAAAAAFSTVDSAGVASGEGTIVLRRRNEPPLAIGPRPTLLGLSVVFTQPHLAAYVAARDADGRRLTVTQPVNPSFLSPVLVFRQQQTIRDRPIPFDTFAVPALHRVVHALAFTPADLAAFGRHLPDNAPATILSVADDTGASHGIGIAPSGQETALDILHVTITIGSYPELVIAAAPQPQVTLAGLAFCAFATLWALLAHCRTTAGARITLSSHD